MIDFLETQMVQTYKDLLNGSSKKLMQQEVENN